MTHVPLTTKVPAAGHPGHSRHAAGRAALAWSVLFALMSLYWAAEGLRTQALPWRLALWDPFWLLGVLLFLHATCVFQMSRRGHDRTTT